MIELGGTHKDSITRFKGVVDGYVKYPSGCNQVLLTPKVCKEDSTTARVAMG